MTSGREGGNSQPVCLTQQGVDKLPDYLPLSLDVVVTMVAKAHPKKLPRLHGHSITIGQAG